MVETQITAGRAFPAFSEMSAARVSAGQCYLLDLGQVPRWGTLLQSTHEF